MEEYSKFPCKTLLNLCFVVCFCQGSYIQNLKRKIREIDNNKENVYSNTTQLSDTSLDTEDIGKTIAVVWTGCILVLLICGCIAKCVFKCFGVGFRRGNSSGRGRQREGRADELVVASDGDDPPKYSDLEREPPEYESSEKSSIFEVKLCDSKSDHDYNVEPPTYQSVTSGR